MAFSYQMLKLHFNCQLTNTGLSLDALIFEVLFVCLLIIWRICVKIINYFYNSQQS